MRPRYRRAEGPKGASAGTPSRRGRKKCCSSEPNEHSGTFMVNLGGMVYLKESFVVRPCSDFLLPFIMALFFSFLKLAGIGIDPVLMFPNAQGEGRVENEQIQVTEC
ncbi:hypothetical protein CEXT_295411 [Caerostris extrusa]|uniref:Uncharacterized protein n=1 Tax=Caerostris extrusa TaxID=172846 RepID=A0AAV4VWG4_CAEEX|nr:hypothetical protein CEXT_295411 [Caerostris extrusa]